METSRRYGVASGGPWCKYDLYQGMPSGIPKVAQNEYAFRRWIWKVYFHHGLSGSAGLRPAVAGAARPHQKRWLRMPQMIRMPLQNRKCPIQLLEQYHPRQLMRQSHLSQGQQRRRRCPRLVAKSICRPNRKYQRQRIPVLIIPQKFSQIFRRHLLAPAVKQHAKGADTSPAQALQGRLIFN